MGYEYKRDKIYFKSSAVANISGSNLREGLGSRTICNIRDGKVREKNGSSTVCNIRNGDVRMGLGSSRIAKIKDIRKQIKNSASLSDEFIAAIWFYFID